MVVQKKGGFQGKRKSKGQFQSPGASKLFEAEGTSDNNGMENTPNKKTPGKSGGTPGQAKKKDMHVSFQLQNKNTPQGSAKKAPKGTPVPGKKTPNWKQEQNLSGKKGKTTLKEFGGMNNSFGAKIERISPPQKGKIYKTPEGKKDSSMLSKQGNSSILKKKQAAADDDDDDDEDDDESDDFDDMEDSSGDGEDDDFDEAGDMNDEDDDEDDDGDDDEDDDEDDDDDDDLGSEDERKMREMLLSLKGKKAKKELKGEKKTVEKETVKKTPQKGSEQPRKDMQKTSVLKENAQTPNKTAKLKQNSVSPEKSPKMKANTHITEKDKITPLDKPKAPVKKEETVKQQKFVPAGSECDRKSLDVEMQRKRERDIRNLFIRGIPSDITVAELKALSPDILDVSLPKSKFQRKNKKVKNYFAFLEFASEQKAEENYTLLQNKKLRGEPVYIDFAGEKSKNKAVSGMQKKEIEQKHYNKKKLYVSGLTVDTTINQVADLFPKAQSIVLNSAPQYRNATVSYQTMEDAAEAFESNSDVKLNGRQITVLYSLETVKKPRKGQKRPQQGKDLSPPTKKFKPVQKEESEDSDDDDDDDDDDDE